MKAGLSCRGLWAVLVSLSLLCISSANGLSSSSSSSSSSRTTSLATAASGSEPAPGSKRRSEPDGSKSKKVLKSMSMSAWVGAKGGEDANKDEEDSVDETKNEKSQQEMWQRNISEMKRKKETGRDQENDEYEKSPSRRRQQSLKIGNEPLLSLNLNLDAIAMSGKGAAERGQEMLQRIHALHKEGYYEVAPDTVSFNSVLKGWKEEGNPEQALDLLRRSLEVLDDSELARDDVENIDVVKAMQPNVISFNTVIWAFAEQGKHEQAMDLLWMMKEYRNPRLQPNVLTYNGVLRAYAEASMTAEAEQMLREMVSGSVDEGCVVPTPNTQTYNMVLLAYCKVAPTPSNDRQTAGNQNNDRISGLAAAKRARQILHQMERMTDDDSNSYEAAPDVYSYTIVIRAFSLAEAPEQAQLLLESMVARGLKPTRYTYTTVMSALCKSGRPDKAQAILYDMMAAYQMSGGTSKHLKPDVVAYSSVIDGWSRISHVDQPHAAQHAEDLLRQMQEVGVRPNGVTYCSVLTAIAKSGTWEASERARALLYAMPPGLATRYHYNACLMAYGRSPRADKALKAFGLLQEMRGHARAECRPDMVSYNSCLMAASNAFGNYELKERSHEIATTVFQLAVRDAGAGQGKRHSRLTSSTFAHFLKATRRLLPERSAERKELLQKTYAKCRRTGCVNRVILQQLRLASQSAEEWTEIVGEETAGFLSYGNDSITNLPREWTRNARR